MYIFVSTQQEISNLVSPFQDSPALGDVGDREEIEPLLLRLDHTARLIKSYTEQLQKVSTLHSIQRRYSVCIKSMGSVSTLPLLLLLLLLLFS